MGKVIGIVVGLFVLLGGGAGAVIGLGLLDSGKGSSGSSQPTKAPAKVDGRGVGQVMLPLRAFG